MEIYNEINEKKSFENCSGLTGDITVCFSLSVFFFNFSKNLISWRELFFSLN